MSEGGSRVRVEEKVVSAIEERREELVSLASDMIRFDTTARGASHDPPREESALQELIARRLETAGAEVQLWEPEPSSIIDGGRQVPRNLSFAGRPQLLARFRGTGGGRSLLFNGHIDAVSSEPHDRWSQDPNRPEIRNGKLYGRGACDMKGGVASMVLAAAVLAELDVELAGDLLVNTVTDEEWNGAGGLASVSRGVRADAGIVPEPTGFDAWVACRGILCPTVTVRGRPGHAEMPQPSWQEGGAVNAIEKTMLVVKALDALRNEWQGRVEHAHAYLQPGDLVPTVIGGGEWWVSYPSACNLTIDVTYLPAQADETGWGSEVEREIEESLIAFTRVDPWLAKHPPTFQWGTDLPPAEVPADHPIVSCVRDAGATVGRPGKVSAIHTWHDAATFTRGGTPTISYGPSGVGDNGEPLLHAIDEYVRVEDLVQCAQVLAITALRFTTGY